MGAMPFVPRAAIAALALLCMACSGPVVINSEDGSEPLRTPAAELPFNRILAVAGFRCNIQEATGLSCQSELSGKGFTFSADGFTPSYTDVPATAP